MVKIVGVSRRGILDAQFEPSILAPGSQVSTGAPAYQKIRTYEAQNESTTNIWRDLRAQKCIKTLYFAFSIFLPGKIRSKMTQNMFQSGNLAKGRLITSITAIASKIGTRTTRGDEKHSSQLCISGLPSGTRNELPTNGTSERFH